jgi:hypothetical protein
MAAPTVVQAVPQDGNPPTATTFTTVAAGDCLVLYICSGGTRTYSVADNAGGTWLQRRRTAGIRVQEVWDCVSHPGGSNVVVTATQGGGSAQAFSTAGFQLRHPNGMERDDVDEHIEAGNVNTHPMAPSGEIDVSAESFVGGTAALNSSGGTLSAKDGNWTLQSLNGSIRLAHYRTTDAALADEDGAFGSTTARAHEAALASYRAIPAAGGPSYSRLERGIRGLNRGLAY